MKGWKTQRNESGKCQRGRERDQDEYEESENSHNSIRNLGQTEEIEVKAEEGENTNCGHICVCRHLHTFWDARAGTGMYVTVCRVTTAETNCRNARLQHQHAACWFGDLTLGPTALMSTASNHALPLPCPTWAEGPLAPQPLTECVQCMNPVLSAGETCSRKQISLPRVANSPVRETTSTQGVRMLGPASRSTD